MSVGKITYYEYKPEEYTYSDEEASAVLNGRLARLLSQLNQKGVQIADERVKIFKNNDIYTCEGVLILISPQTVKKMLRQMNLQCLTVKYRMEKRKRAIDECY